MTKNKIIENGEYEDGSTGYGIVNLTTNELVHGDDPLSYDEAERELEHIESEEENLEIEIDDISHINEGSEQE